MGNWFVLYTGGAQGTDQLAEELFLHYGVQVEVLIPPRTFQESYNYSRVPSAVGSGQSTYRRGGRETQQTGAHRRITFSFDTAQLRNCPEGWHRVRFWYTGTRRRRVQGGAGWSVQLALDQGKKVFLFDIACQVWFHSVHDYNVVQWSLEVGTRFVRLSGKPTLHHSSAVVGSRVLDENTR